MNNLFSKLNNRRGASILLALLLFLICALAGAAALTAASANIGRFSYLEQDQQQYLAVSSAAKLLRSQLDGFTAEGVFKAEVIDESDANLTLDSDISHGFSIVIGESEFVPPTVFTYKLGNGDTSGGLIDLIKDDIEKYVKSVIYTYVTEELADNQLWKKTKLADNADYRDVLEGYSGEMEFTITCDQIIDGDGNPIEVTALIKIDEPTVKLEKGSSKNITVTVSCDKQKYEMTGEIKVKDNNIERVDADTETITRPYYPGEKDDLGNDIAYPVDVSVILSSTATVTVEIDLNNTISRVNEETEGDSTS